MKKPTQIQLDTLIFIDEYIKENEFPPTIREISLKFGGISTNAVNDRLILLTIKGCIERPHYGEYRSRAIRITKLGREYLSGST